MANTTRSTDPVNTTDPTNPTDSTDSTDSTNTRNGIAGLHLAAKYGRSEVVKVLVSRCNLDQQDDEGLTALMKGIY